MSSLNIDYLGPRDRLSCLSLSAYVPFAHLSSVIMPDLGDVRLCIVFT